MADKAENTKPALDPAQLKDIEDFLDVPYEITILVGSTTMTINELLNLGRGAIVELTKSAGESFDVLANGQRIAMGDVTIIDDRFAIRITECVPPGGMSREDE